MRLGLLRFSWIAALAASWGLTWTGEGWAQLRTPRNGPAPAMSARAPATEDARAAEAQVELAWLADPVTFPYYLEARVHGGRMEIRGFVPSKAIQDHALRLARLHCPGMMVVDATKEHPSLTVHPARVPAEKLQAAVTTALQQAMPATAKNLKVECAEEGKVIVAGPVTRIEEKLAVSQALRRLPGCAYVVNLTQVRGTAPLPPSIASTPPRPMPETKPPVAPPPMTPRPMTPPSTPIAKTPEPPAMPPRVARLPEKEGDIQPVQAREPAKMPGGPGGAGAAPPKKADGPFGGFFSKVLGKKSNPPPKDAAVKKTPTAPRDPIKITDLPAPLPKGVGETPKGPAELPREVVVDIPKGPPPIMKAPAPLPKGAPPAKTAKGPGKAGEPYEAEGVIIIPDAPKPAKALTPAQLSSRLNSLFPKARAVITSEGGNKIKVELTVRTHDESNDLAGRVLALPEFDSYDVNLFIRIDDGKK